MGQNISEAQIMIRTFNFNILFFDGHIFRKKIQIIRSISLKRRVFINIKV